MAIVEPGKGRAVIKLEGAGLRITIPAAAQPFGVIFLSLWLTMWAVGEAAALRQVLSGQPLEKPLFLMIWLAGWTLAGAWAAYVLLWQLMGMEILELSSTSLHQRKQISFYSRSKEYAVANIANLRLAPPEPKYIRGKYVIANLSFDSGAISFDYGRDTHRFGQGLDEADAQYVMREMCKQVKSLCPSAAPAEEDA